MIERLVRVGRASLRCAGQVVPLLVKHAHLQLIAATCEDNAEAAIVGLDRIHVDLTLRPGEQ